MTKTGHIQVRIDEEIKQSAEDVFARLGFTSSDAVRMFYHQVTLTNGLPFDVKIPNAETLEAIEDLKHSRNTTRVASVDELFKSLDD